MQFICLVHHDPALISGMSETERAQLDADSLAYDEDLKRNGHLVLAHALRPASGAKAVKRRGGKMLVTDGPFTETKEQLVGFIVIEASGIDEATALASNIPLAKTGMIVVRETYDIAD
jgi:hypothetical protein